MNVSAWPSWLRALVAVLSLLSAGLVLWPGPATARVSTWEELMLPLLPGGHITRGYYLSSPRRGEERDVIFTARRDDKTLGTHGRIEVHIVDKGQWPGIRETTSFGVAYETPRSSAPAEDLEAVTETIANHLRSNDRGLGPVSTIPLGAEPSSPWITRSLEHASGARGMVVALLLALALGFVSSMRPVGDAYAASLLLVLGLALRLPHLDVPFTHDQDVQRLFTGQLPLGEILTGKGLEDRHPPLWFVVLHAVGLLGQTEAIARAPAAICGALCGPAIVWANRLVRGRAGAAGALCGLLVTLSPELVTRSREVSEIPLFSLLVVATIALTLRLTRIPSRSLQRWLAVVTALLAWTYYLAPLVLVGIVVPLAVARRLRKEVIVAFGMGAIAAAPAFVLGAVTLVRDHGARTVAASFPTLAWGDRSPMETLYDLVTQAVSSVGAATVCVATIVALVAMVRRRNIAPAVAFGVTITTALGIALVSKVARVQPYYLTAVVACLPLAIAFAAPQRSKAAPAWTFACLLSLLLHVRTSQSGAGVSYMPDTDAFMPRFASFVLQRSEERIIVVAHYDATLLAYYLQRAAGGRVVWPDEERSGEFVFAKSGRRVLPLARVHALSEGSGEEARTALRAALEQAPALVIERDAFVLAEVHDELAHCEVLLTAPTARLLQCEKRSMK